jgi:hypothetical protein
MIVPIPQKSITRLTILIELCKQHLAHLVIAGFESTCIEQLSQPIAVGSRVLSSFQAYFPSEIPAPACFTKLLQVRKGGWWGVKKWGW